MALHLKNLLSYVVSSKNLINKDYELFIVTNFGKIVGTKEQVKELVKVIKAGSSWEGVFWLYKETIRTKRHFRKIIRDMG